MLVRLYLSLLPNTVGRLAPLFPGVVLHLQKALLPPYLPLHRDWATLHHHRDRAMLHQVAVPTCASVTAESAGLVSLPAPVRAVAVRPKQGIVQELQIFKLVLCHYSQSFICI